jgi:putative SOS response-associated peptidase YedK
VETIDTNPLFKSSFKKNRCLIPATGFLEWGTDKRKYLIQLTEPLFAFAGIYRAGEVTIVTCTPNAFMSTIHDRMPVILSPSHYDPWLLEGGKDWLVPFQGEMRSTCLAEPASRKSSRTPQDVQGELF